MKDRKLRVRVTGIARDFYLCRVEQSRAWHIIFAPPLEVREKLKVKRIVRSTGTTEIPAAQERAARIIDDHWSIANLEKAGILSARPNKCATLGELFAVYVARAKERPATVRCNVNSMRFLVRTALGKSETRVRQGYGKRGAEDKIDDVSTDVLTGELIEGFERKAAGRLSQTSIASYVRQARAILALPKMKFYAQLTLPDLTSFRAASVENPKRRYLEPIDMNAMLAMDAATPRLAETDPAVYVAHLLFAHLAMRNIEILHARRSWIVDGRIGIIERPSEGFAPKGRSAWLPIGPKVLAELSRFEHLCTDGYLVPGATMTERYDAIYRRHSRWVSTWIKDRTKTSYELRRYAGSRLLDLPGVKITDVRDFLRHENTATTERWYQFRLQNRELPTIDLGELVPDNVIVIGR